MMRGLHPNKLKRAATIVFLSIFLLLSFPAEVYAAEDASSAGVTIKVAYSDEDGIIVNEDGNLDGYAVKYLEEVARYTGWKYEFIHDSWQDAMGALNRGEIDMLIMVHYTEERTKDYLFSALPMAQDTTVLYVDEKNDIYYQDYEAFDGLRIGVEAGTSFASAAYEHILELGIDCEIVPYDSVQDAKAALKTGEIGMIATSGFGYHSDVKIVDRFNAGYVYFAMGKDNTELMYELDSAMQKLKAQNRELESQLLMTYYNLSSDINNLYLTRDEQLYLDGVGPIVIKTFDDRKPMAYTSDDGSMQGILVDYLDALGDMVGLEFIYEPFAPTTTEQGAAAMSEDDFCIFMMGQSERTSDLAKLGVYKSEGLLDFALAYIRREGETIGKYDTNTFALTHEMEHLAELIWETNPDSEIIYYDTSDECMDALLSGDVNIAVLDEYTASYLLQKPAYAADLRQMAGSGAFVNEIHIYAPEQHRYLVSILNKVLDHLSDKQQLYMVSNAAHSHTYQYQPDDMLYQYGRFIILLAAALVVICVLSVVLYIRMDRFKKQKKETEELQERAEKDRRMNQALEDALNAANAANDSKRNFLANMSHDIRTPMNAIMGFSSMMSTEADDPAKVREYSRRIGASSQQLMALVNDILDMSKIESGKTSLNNMEFSLPELLDEIMDMLAPQARMKKQDFEVKTKGVLPEYLLGDKVRLHQILTNLLTNALKYTQDGGQICMTVEATDHAKQNHAHLRFTVEDNGCGMSQEFLKHIFDPFARERKMHSDEIHGTGLGMPITKALVNLMGGTIDIKSTPDVGSVFIVELMFALTEYAQDTDFWKRCGIERMLVVDDEEDVCTDIQLIMKGVGVEVDYATSGYRGIEMVMQAHDRGNDYSVVLVDWKMPGMDGQETARMIRQKTGADTPILMITAFAADEIENSAKSVGVNKILSKPFFLSYFQLALEELLGENAMEQTEPIEDRTIAGMRVLAAEDHEFNADLLVELLSIYDVSCDMTHNGQQALDRFLASEAGYYDIVLLDVQMPVMDGHEATRRIRSSDHPDASSIPIIAMTANAFEDDVKAALEAGMTAHAAKPIGKEKLKAILQQHCKK